MCFAPAKVSQTSIYIAFNLDITSKAARPYMTVETYIPNKTTTLETPVKVLESGVTHKPSEGTRIGFISLGCPKNLVDSERILTQLRTEGYDVVPTYKDADLSTPPCKSLSIPSAKLWLKMARLS